MWLSGNAAKNACPICSFASIPNVPAGVTITASSVNRARGLADPPGAPVVIERLDDRAELAHRFTFGRGDWQERESLRRVRARRCETSRGTTLPRSASAFGSALEDLF